MIRSFGSVRAVIVAAAAIIGLGAGACAQQSDAPPAAAGPEPGAGDTAIAPPAAEAATPEAAPETPRKGIDLQFTRYASGSTHFQRPGPRTELISDNMAIDVAVGERAVGGALPGGSWTLISAGPFDKDSAEVKARGVVVVGVAADEAGGRPVLTIDNRLDRTFYVPPIIIDLRGAQMGAKAGKGCNIAPGGVMSHALDKETLSFVLANVETSMDAPPCGPDHVLFPDR